MVLNFNWFSCVSYVSDYTYGTISGVLCSGGCDEESSKFHISVFNFQMVILSDVGEILYRSGLRKLSQFFVPEAVFAMEIMSDSKKSVNRRISTLKLWLQLCKVYLIFFKECQVGKLSMGLSSGVTDSGDASWNSDRR